MRYSSRAARTAILSATVLLTVFSSAFAQQTVSEQELLAVLKSAETPASEKAITCKKLAIHGSSASVPELARLLPDPQLSSWARIALEAIPGPEADEALRQAAGSLEGLLLVGTINSIGVRRDQKAVELLAAKLSEEEEVASAAAVALGHIGNAPATQSLRETLSTASGNVRSAVAEGLVLCAERRLAAGDVAEAVKIYDEVRKADVPKQRKIEATRGAILARGDEGIPLLLEQFRSPDKNFFQLGLGTFREFPGRKVDEVLAQKLNEAAPERAAFMIYAMADRPETAVLPAIVKAAADGPKQVRQAAVDALGRIGDASCLPALLEIALESDDELSQRAKESLAELPGQKIDAEILALLPKAQGNTYPLLLDLVGQRRIDAVPELLKALDHSDPNVRKSALRALGETVSLKKFPLLISQVVSPQTPEDLPAAEEALKAASIRMPDREACAEELALALEKAPSATKTTLLEILADVGGSKALKTLAQGAKSDDPNLQDTASRLLGKWNSVDAAPVLLDLAKTAPEARYQIRALRGYVGLARKFAMPEPERAKMCQNAMNIAKKPAEKKLVLDVLKLHPSRAGLTIAVNALESPEIKTEATEATLVIAQKVKSQGADVSQLLAKAGLEQVNLEILKAEYGAGPDQKDVTRILRKHTGDLSVITLPAASYNANFGGDPAPGKVKQLKVQYQINGQKGEATFPENALIIFPVPAKK